MKLNSDEEESLKEAEKKAYLKERKKIVEARGREKARDEAKGPIDKIVKSTKGFLNFFGFDL